MTRFEVTVNQERFIVKSRPGQPGTYDYDWINGPVSGYGFSERSNAAHKRPREELVESIRSFLETFYGPGGIGEEDFPDHVPAAMRHGRRT